MAIPFSQIGPIRIPGYRNEFALGNAPYSGSMKVLIVAPVAAGATAETGRVARPAENAEAAYGQGSLLATMLNYARLTRPFLDYRVLPIVESGTPASLAITVTALPPEGTHPFWVLGGQRMRQVTRAAGDTLASFAAKIAAAINQKVTLPGDGKAMVDMVSATSAAAVVTVTARNGGLCLNGSTWFSCEWGGIVSPLSPFVTSVFTAGTGVPDLAAAFAGVDANHYAWVISAYSDTASLAAIDLWLEQQWSPMAMRYGWAVAATFGSQGSVASLGDAMNDRKRVLFAMRDSAEPAPVVTACAGAEMAFVFDFGRSLSDVQIFARGLTGRELRYLTGPWKASDTFTDPQRNLLYFDGVSPLVPTEGTVMTERVITTAQRRVASGLEDISYLDINGPCIDAWTVLYQRHYVWNNHQNTSIVGDQEEQAEGQTRPQDLKRTLVLAYDNVRREGRIVQDVEGYEANLNVEIAADPVRFDVQQNIYRANPLYIVATRSVVGETAPAILAA